MPYPHGPALIYVSAGSKPTIYRIDDGGFYPGVMPRWDRAVCKALLDLAATTLAQAEHEKSIGITRLETDRG